MTDRVQPPGKTKRRRNPLYALRSSTLATLDEIEAAALAELKADIFLCGEQEDLISAIPLLCKTIRTGKP